MGACPRCASGARSATSSTICRTVDSSGRSARRVRSRRRRRTARARRRGPLGRRRAGVRARRRTGPGGRSAAPGSALRRDAAPGHGSGPPGGLAARGVGAAADSRGGDPRALHPLVPSPARRLAAASTGCWAPRSTRRAPGSSASRSTSPTASSPSSPGAAASAHADLRRRPHRARRVRHAAVHALRPRGRPAGADRTGGGRHGHGAARRPRPRGRRLMLARTYPAARGAAEQPLAPYASARLAIATGLPSVRATARLGARPRPGRLPVVLFSPGFGTPRVLDAGARRRPGEPRRSVIAVDHTGEAPVEFPDGSVALLDDSVALPGAPSGSAERVIAAAAATRLADMRLILHRLAGLPSGPRADVRRVAAVGHSLGRRRRRRSCGPSPESAPASTWTDRSSAPPSGAALDRPFLAMSGWRGLDPCLRHLLAHVARPAARAPVRGPRAPVVRAIFRPSRRPRSAAGGRRPRGTSHPSARTCAAFLDRFVRGRRRPCWHGAPTARAGARGLPASSCCAGP